MILKRWAFNFAGLIFTSISGVFGLQYLHEHLLVPPAAGVLILLCYIIGGLLLTHYMAISFFPVTKTDNRRPDIPRQPWAWLRLRGENKPGFPLNKGQVVVGRDVRCEIMLNHSSVSRKHAEIVRLAEGYLLRDLNSANGTFVNGQRVQEYLMQDGDRIQFGDVQMAFQAPKRPEVSEVDEDGEPISVAQLLSPEPLPLETEMAPFDYGINDDYDYNGDVPEGGTQVWQRPE